MDNNRIKVLLIEDNPDHAELIQEMVLEVKGAPFDVECARRLSTGIERLLKGDIGVVLLDLSLPDSQGVETFVKVHSQLPDMPVVVLSALDDEIVAVKAVQAGAQDYLVKGQVDCNLLGRSLSYAIERNRMWKEVGRLRRDWENIFQSIGNPTIILDPEHGVIAANQVVESITGKSSKELLGRKCYEIFHETNQPIDGCPMEKVIESGCFEATELEVETLNGTSLVTCTPVFDKAGRLEKIIHAATDITERKRMERELAAEKELLAVTLRSIGDGVITTDTEGKIVLLNREAEKLTGWSLTEAMGRPLADVFYIVNEKTRIRCENPVEKVLQTGGIVGLANHTVLVAKDAVERVIADSGAPIRDKENNILGVVLVFRDVTEKRKMEEDIQKNHKLESIGVLAGGIAHDFNNILTAILGNVSLAKISFASGDEVYGLLTEAEKASLRARDLTQQLLTFSKGGAPIVKTVSIVDLLKESVSFALRGSNVRCEYGISDDIWPVEVDEGQITQVVNNLIINADQAMPEGGIIRIECENFIKNEGDGLPLKEGRYTRINIQDQGVGIPEEHLKKIFDPYFSTKQKGSGLGLPTAYSIIGKHDGYIDVESQMGLGTNFYIYLPASSKEVLVKKDLEEATLTCHGKILVLDDEETIREVIIKMLGSIGYQVTAVTNGQEAIELYKRAIKSSDPFDVVILDLTIPGGMGGKETIVKLLEIDPEVKAIATSGYSNEAITADFKKYNFSDFIAKPYNVHNLSKVVYKLIMGEE